MFSAKNVFVLTITESNFDCGLTAYLEIDMMHKLMLIKQ